MPDVLLATETDPGAEPPRRRSRLLRWVLFGVSAVLAGLLVAVWVIREPMEELTRDNLATARSRWHTAGIRSYDLALDVLPPGQAEPNRFEVTVREGRLTGILCNGEPSTSGEPELFTVAGLFDTLERELDLREDAAGPFAGGALLRVRFHGEYGFPERYLRLVSGTNRSSEFNVIEFEPKDAGGG